MKMSESMVKMLIELAKGIGSLEGIALNISLSRNRCSEIAKTLEQYHLVSMKRVGMRKILALADSPVATSFREMYLAKPYMKHLDVLYGSKLDLLQLMIYEPKSVEALSKITKLSKGIVRSSLRQLRHANLLWREKSRYFFAKKAHPEIFNFLNALRTFTPENKRILWKFNDEEIFRTREESMITALTGLNRFGDFGITVNTVDFICIKPVQKLSRNEVFVHGLMQIGKEPRILGIAIAFYYKNHINDKQISFLIEKYDLMNLFSEFKKTIDEFAKDRNSAIQNEILPSTSGQEIQRVLDIYGVKNVQKK